MIKAVFFDFADTLAHKKDLYATIGRILEAHGHFIDLNKLQMIHKQMYEETIFPDKTDYEFYLGFNTMLLKQLGIHPREELCYEIYHACKSLPWVLYNDSKAILELTYPMGILSNFNNHLKNLIRELFPEKIFQWIIISEEKALRKPDLRFYQLILEQTGFSAKEIVYVGDSLCLDYEPAENIGFKAVLVDRVGWKNLNPKRSIKNLFELGKYINVT